jgi:peptide/nickel transport system ATP-binding protein
MRQRAVLAMALVTEPDLVILDEPTSALDVLTQAGIMNVLKRIKRELGTSFILITHDVATSSEIADRVALMYAGQIVEVAGRPSSSSSPPPLFQAADGQRAAAAPGERPGVHPGQPPSLLDLPAGCRFAPRCPSRFERCAEDPGRSTLPGRRQVRCWLMPREHAMSKSTLDRFLSRSAALGAGSAHLVRAAALGLSARRLVRAVDGVTSSSARRGGGLRRRSGCGKSSLARTLLGCTGPPGRGDLRRPEPGKAWTAAELKLHYRPGRLRAAGPYGACPRSWTSAGSWPSR